MCVAVPTYRLDMIGLKWKVFVSTEFTESAENGGHPQKDDAASDGLGAGNALTGLVRYFKISVCLYRERCGLAQ